MSDTPFATRGADERVAPADAGAFVGTTTPVTGAAANVSLPLTTGAAYFTLQARGSNVYVRLKATASAAATTAGNASNGVQIPNGQSADFWVTPDRVVMDVIGDAACSLFWWQSSPDYQIR